jgi:CRISPR type III-B/RAMP module-associated protein Cmr5
MATEIKRKSISQNRAKFAWEYAEESKRETKLKEKYKSHVREFPMLVLTSGLINAIAFAYEKGGVGGKESDGDKGWKLLYNHLEKWLKTDNDQRLLFSNEGTLIAILLAIPPNDMASIRAISNETISLFTWLKRFVA